MTIEASWLWFIRDFKHNIEKVLEMTIVVSFIEVYNYITLLNSYTLDNNHWDCANF